MRTRLLVATATLLLGCGGPAPALAAGGQPAPDRQEPVRYAQAPAQQCVSTPDAVAGDLWAQHRLQPERAWPLTTGAGVTVAVVDSGVDIRVPQLAGQVAGGLSITGPSTSDCSGHGTLVAGIIAAKPMPGTDFHGVAPGAHVLSIRQNEMDPGTATRGDTTGMAQAIRYAVGHGAGVINVSATSPVDVADLRAAVNYALARDVVVVAAAGNDVAGTGTAPATYYPAAYPGVLAVAGTDRSDHRVDTSHPASYVGIAAPGQDVVSTGPNGPGRYATATGTSFAAPFVAGVAALVRAYRPELTQAQVVARIRGTADHPASGEGGIGAGVVDPYAAVTAVLPDEYTDRTGTAAPARGALPTHRPSPPVPGRTLALAGAAASVVMIGAVLLLGIVVPHGRARGWSPGRRGP